MNSSSNALNPAVVAQLKDLLGPMFSELVKRFTQDGSERLQRIHNAQEPIPDFDAIFAEAHGLKGSSQNVGAARLEALCLNLERNAKSGNTPLLEQDIAALEQEFAAVCKALRLEETA